MENFNLVSSSQSNRFMLALGHHPFQSNNEMKVGKSFSEVYQRHRLVLLLHSIIEELSKTYYQLNEDVFAIM